MIRRKRFVPCCCALLVLSFLPAGLALAADASKLEIHGYLTQAYGDISFAEGPLNLLGRHYFENELGLREGGTFDYRNLALQFRYAISEKDFVLVQLSHEKNGSSEVSAARPEVRLDWGFYEHRFGANTSVRVGRVAIPFGIYNQLRDAGTTLPFYRPSFSIYGEGTATSEIIDGIYFSHTFAADSSWPFDVETYFGEYEALESNPLEVNDVKKTRAEDNLGFQFWLNTPVEGLRFGASWATKKISGGQEGLLRLPGEKSKYDDFLLSLEGSFTRWVVRAEYRAPKPDPTVSPLFPITGNRLTLDLKAWTVQFGYYATEKFRIFIQAEEQSTRNSSPDFTHPISANLYQDLGLALNYQISSNVVAKVEYHQYDVEVPAGVVVFLPSGIKLDPINFGADDGKYWIVSLSASF